MLTKLEMKEIIREVTRWILYTEIEEISMFLQRK